MPCDSPAGISSRRRRLQWLVPLFLIAATLALLIPFIKKPFHIDDPMYIWAAQQIVQHPLDPYGFSVNWSGVVLPMPVEMKNPPLICYYLAGASKVVGWSEIALHCAMLLPAVGTILGVYFLALELSPPEQDDAIERAALAAMAALLTPLFLVSASTIMSDVPMLCCYVWAIWFWARGLRTGRNWPLLAGAILIAAASLTKYFGITLFPLLFAYGMLVRRRIGAWALWLLLPAAILLAFECWARGHYGRGLLLGAMTYSRGKQAVIGDSLPARLLAGFSFTGGGAITIVMLLAGMARRRTLVIWSLVLIGTLVLLASIDAFPAHPQAGRVGPRETGYWIQLAVFAAAGVGLIGFAAGIGLRDRRDPSIALLALWILGTFCFSTILNWSVNGRSVLPLVPAAAILTSRFDFRARLRPGSMVQWIGSRRVMAASLLSGGAIAIWCTMADYSHAAAARRAAELLEQKYTHRPGQTWFLGHWGFQYYMQQRGARPVDFVNPFSIRTGDLIVQPINNAYHFTYRGDAPGDLPVINRIDVPVLPGLALMQPQFDAGFYSDMWGPLPFAFGRVPPDRYLVQEVKGPIQLIRRTGERGDAPRPEIRPGGGL